MADRATEERWARERKIDEEFPRVLTAAAIRKFREDVANAATKSEEEAASYAMLRYERRLVEIVAEYFFKVAAPRDLAERRRRAGDPAASVRDYDCGCEVRDADGIPICAKRRPACKFEGLRSPNRFPGDGERPRRDGTIAQPSFMSVAKKAPPEDVAKAIAIMEKMTKRVLLRRQSAARPNQPPADDGVRRLQGDGNSGG